MIQLTTKEKETLTKVFDDNMNQFLVNASEMKAVNTTEQAGIAIMGFALGAGLVLSQDYDMDDTMEFTSQWQKNYYNFIISMGETK